MLANRSMQSEIHRQLFSDITSLSMGPPCRHPLCCFLVHIGCNVELSAITTAVCAALVIKDHNNPKGFSGASNLIFTANPLGGSPCTYCAQHSAPQVFETVNVQPSQPRLAGGWNLNGSIQYASSMCLGAFSVLLIKSVKSTCRKTAVPRLCSMCMYICL